MNSKKIIKGRLIWIILIGVLQSNFTIAQFNSNSIIQLEQAMIKQPKPVIVFLHASWCSYCILMQKKTWQNQDLVNRLNNDFYFVSFDVEHKNDITFFNKTYHFQKKGINGGIHQMAQLFSSKNEYPTVIFYNKNFEKIYEYNGYLKAENMLLLLNNLY